MMMSHRTAQTFVESYVFEQCRRTDIGRTDVFEVVARCALRDLIERGDYPPAELNTLRVWVDAGRTLHVTWRPSPFEVSP